MREVISTLVRGTVSMVDADGGCHEIRLSGEPEPGHRDILAKLGIHSLPPSAASKIPATALCSD